MSSRGDLRSNDGGKKAEMIMEGAGDVNCKIRFESGLN